MCWFLWLHYGVQRSDEKACLEALYCPPCVVQCYVRLGCNVLMLGGCCSLYVDGLCEGSLCEEQYSIAWLFGAESCQVEVQYIYFRWLL